MCTSGATLALYVNAVLDLYDTLRERSSPSQLEKSLS